MYPSVIVFILVLIISECKGHDANSCNVTPKDEYIEAGSDTEVICQSSCVRGQVFWTLNNRQVNESLSKAINTSHTVLSLKDFTYHSATLQCHSATTHQVIGGATIKTYTKPSKISCMLHYAYQGIEVLPQLFTCNWEHHMNSSLKINYTMRVSSVLASQIEHCSPSVTTCTMKDAKIPLVMNITVTVRARTAYWEADSDPYEFEPYSILKIIPPKIHVKVSSDHLLVEWKRSVVEGTCRCEVKFSKAFSDRTEEKTVSRTLNEDENGTVTQKLESCSTYKVSVRCALVKAPWSDWSQEKTAQTELNEIGIRLQLWRKVAKPQRNGVRKVHVMWTELPATCPGTFTYAIKKTSYDEHKTEISYMDASCNSSTCGVDMHVGQQAHTLNLTVFRDGTQLAEESVYVPAIKESLPQVPEVETSATEGVILVSWKPPVEPVRSYMIDWTHNGHEFYWMETTYTNMSLFGLLDKKPYNITVTPLFDDRTGHGTEALQVCATLGDPGNIPIPSVHASDTSAFVSWSIEPQVCSEAVINFTIFYSNTQTGPTLNITVVGTARNISLKDLNPDTQYDVYIKGTARNGTTQSSLKVFETKRFDPRLLTVLSVSGSIVIILVCSLGLCCAVQWKKFREKPVPNPGLSSLALWQSSDHQKVVNNPSESVCDRVVTMEPQETSISPLALGCNQAIDQIEEYTDPAALRLNIQNDELSELAETELVSSGESTALLPPVNSPFNPYRSQSSVEVKAPETHKQCKPFPEKQQEKTAPMTVYVTLNMFEQGQGR